MNAAILLSGGVGTRIGADIPKQYITVEGKTIVSYTLSGLIENTFVDAIWIVADSSWNETIISDVDTSKIKGFSLPGKNRQLSIYNALCDMSDMVSDDDVILIQDAVRPLTPQQTITDCLTKIDGHDGALPVLPMKDTIYFSENGSSISSLLDRGKLFAGQAPEAYRYGKYKRACEALLPDEILNINGAAEPAVLAGMDVAIFPGDEGNFKITTAEDLKRFTMTINGKGV